MAEEKLDVVGCGSMVVDLFYRTPRIIRADEKILLRAHTASAAIERTQVGGLVLNHLGWGRILGLKTGIFGKLGDDRNGEFLRDGMDRLGIRHHLTFDGTASAFASIFVDANGDRAIYMARGATGELTPAEVRSRHGAFIRRANLVSTEISQLPIRTVLAILLFARTHSIPTILDVDVPPSDAIGSLGTRAELERALKLATWLKPSKAAAREIVTGNGRDTLKMAEAIRARYGSRAVIITEGDKGCSIAARDTSVRVPAFKVKQIDSTGAGDAFLAGIFAGLRLGMPWDKIGRLANAAGAVAVTRLGAFPSGFEVREEVLDLYGEAIALPTPRLDSEPREAAIGDSTGESEVEKFFDLALTELAALRGGLNIAAISRTVEIIRTALGRGGRVHVTGVGKPEHVARYAASLFCSVGTPATFLHATETLHGSLGQVHPRDIVIAISNSGNTDELLSTASAIREQGAQLIAITGNKDSSLAQLADLVIHVPVPNEGGGLGLVPRISVLGEVLVLAGLSVALELAHGLTVEEYSRWHRAGTIGEAARRLAETRTSRRRA
ncbi:PfkB family carbohydrate kinase [Candidatus Binatus sp.]|jgi:sugar/nucleoside kinase (ribokinase family)/D-arabinose 5-phosphate isomerase GutQ|uniref:PfkB family carbohydrate kinase n=2 Tax=Candidatus Binatus sp. TaxID=2811406 RepID=UPI003C41E700